MTLVNALAFSQSVKRLCRKNRMLLCMSLIALGLASCDSGSSGRDPLADGSQARVEKLKTDVSVDEARALAKPGGGEFSLDPVPTLGKGDTVEPGSGTLPARGLNTQLFAESMRNDDDRFARLEKEVQTIRNEFDHVSPSVNRLVAIEADIQNLVSQLEVLLQQEGSAGTAAPVPEIAPADVQPVTQNQVEQLINTQAGATAEPLSLQQQQVQAAPTPAPAAPPVVAPPPTPVAPPVAAAPAPQPVPQPAPTPAPAPATVAGASLTSIRVGDHPGKTRIVMETSERIKYTADIDNNEHILMVSFEKGQPAIDVASLAIKSGLVKSVSSTVQEGKGFVLAFTLIGSSSVISQDILEPGAESPRYRVYIDLAR